RDMQNWRDKLNLIAESRSEEVNGWVQDNFKELRTLADNPSLQLYMTELQMRDEKKPAKAEDGEPSQKSYLRNLILFTAARTGFGAGNVGANVPANVQKSSGKSGLAVIDAKNSLLVSTVLAPATREQMLEHVKQATPAQEGLIDVRKDGDGAAYLGFTVPVYSIQGDHNPEAQIGRVIGLKTLDGAGLFPLLKHPGVTEKTMETVLVRKNGDKIEYLSPLQDGSAPLAKEEEANSAKLDAAALMETPGSFVTQLTDYRGKKVLATSRAVTGTPWVMVVKIDALEALEGSIKRRHTLEALFFLIIAVIVLIVATTWWRANSKRSLVMSTHFQRLAARAQAQEQLLRLVADHQPEPIYIVDEGQNVRFANQKAADEASMSVESVAGRSLFDVRGGARAGHVTEKCAEVLQGGQVQYELYRESTGR
ncbi:MAG: PAS domain-containing protein, partial [Rickettsiales bacterium]|nr:PAS domain-containing protein [Rickettsiales bacterium]